MSASANIAGALEARAAADPARKALILPDGTELSFAELERAASRRARALAAAGIGRGARAALMVPPGLEFFALAFALFKLGAIPVFIDPGMGRAGLSRCLDDAAPEAFIGIPLAHAARVVLGWARRSLRVRVTVGPRLFWGGASLARLVAAADEAPRPAEALGADEPAAILFTSGSTGPAKGALYTHGNFQAQIEALRALFGIGPGEVDLPTFPLFALFAPALGMTSVLPEMDFTRPGSVDPESIVGPVQGRGVHQLFGSPALLDRVGRWAEGQDVRLESLRRVVSAGAPVAPKILERFAKLLPEGCAIHTPYGATEALPVACIDSREILSETWRGTAEGRGVCVGRPVPGVRVDVLKVSDEPVPEWSEDLRAAPGEIGEFVVRGPAVTREYFNRPEATALAKVRFPDGTVGHRMGDVGRVDEAGRLWFCGRKSQRVETEAGTLYTIPCEGVFNRHPKARRTALVGVGPAPRQTPVLVVEPEEGVEPDEALKEELRGLGAGFGHTRTVRVMLFHPSFPVDIRHNAKIFREKLAVWAASQLS
ncbi:MAG TPA: fatty acid CoA ligase family protein [Elusimicrobiota bacterium]|nr:fatty acid CoA ligase family protein [Elusimicrobiota bacterium]